MRSPFRSEPAAFRFVVLSAVAWGAIAVASLGGAVAALAVWAAVSLLLAGWYLRRRRTHGIAVAPAHAGPPGEHRLLLVADDAPGPGALAAARRADRVLVVAPASVPPLRRWTGDVDDARGRAHERAEAAARALREARVEVAAAVGDGDAVQAVEDSLRSFGGNEILVATGDDALVARLRARYALPVEQASS